MVVYHLLCHLDLNYMETDNIYAFSALTLSLLASLRCRLNFDILFFKSS